MPAHCQLIFVRESNMIPLSRSTRATWRVLLMSLLAAVASPSAAGQEARSPSPPASTTGGPLPMNWTVEQDHQNMMDQLGIRALRPGPSGDERAPNHANYDESKANPFPNIPDALMLNSGQKVTTLELWQKRRAEIIEGFECCIYGRVPKEMPKVTWSVKAVDH